MLLPALVIIYNYYTVRLVILINLDKSQVYVVFEIPVCACITLYICTTIQTKTRRNILQRRNSLVEQSGAYAGFLQGDRGGPRVGLLLEYGACQPHTKTINVKNVLFQSMAEKTISKIQLSKRGRTLRWALFRIRFKVLRCTANVQHISQEEKLYLLLEIGHNGFVPKHRNFMLILKNLNNKIY